MSDRSPSDKLAHELLRTVTERSTPAESLVERAYAVENVLATAERLGIRDEMLDHHARSALIGGLKEMGHTRRWQLPWKSKRHQLDRSSTSKSPRELPPGTSAPD